MRKIIAEEGQSIFDLALIGYGSVAGVFMILEDNDIESLESKIAPGTEILCREEIIDEQVHKEYELRGVRPVTAAVEDKPIAFSGGFSKGFR